MSRYDMIGSADVQGEKAAKASEKSTLDKIEEEIGPETYKDIIAKISSGEELSDYEKKIVRNLKRKMGRTEH